MGRLREVKYYNGMYLGGLTEEKAGILNSFKGIDVVDDLRHCIYDLSESSIFELKEGVEKLGVVPEIPKPMGTARDYQTVGAAIMYYALKCICGDSVGLGKTVQLAILANVLKVEKEKQPNATPFRYLFLTEKSSCGQIRDKLIRFTGDYVYSLGGGEKDVSSFLDMNPDSANFSVCGSHSLIKQPKFFQWILRYSPFDLLVIDESSIFRDSSSQMSKDGKDLCNLFNRVVFLNATPFETKLMDFYTQLSILDPAMLPTKTNFQKEYCVYDYRGYIPKFRNYKNQASFKEQVSLRYFARTRESLGALFEDNEAEIIFTPLSQEQRNLMPKTQLWRMVVDCPCALLPSIEFNEKNVPKVAALMKILNDDICVGEKVVIFSHYKETHNRLQEYLTERGFKNEVLNGETSVKKREQFLRGFNDGAFDILITNVSRGLDLEGCDTSIFYSFDPNPQKMVQMGGRTTREFDIVGKNVKLLCSEGKEKKFIEEKVRMRAIAGGEFARADKSIILDLLKGE